MSGEAKVEASSEVEQLRGLLQKLSVLQHAPRCKAHLVSPTNFVEFVDWRTAIQRYRLEGGVAPLAHFVHDDLHSFLFDGCDKSYVYAHFSSSEKEAEVMERMSANILPKLTGSNQLLCIRKVVDVLSSCHMRAVSDDGLVAALSAYSSRFDRLAKCLPAGFLDLVKEKKRLRIFIQGLVPKVRERAEVAMEVQGIKTFSGLLQILNQQLERWAMDFPGKPDKRRPAVEGSSSRATVRRFSGAGAASGRPRRRGHARRSGGGVTVMKPAFAAQPKQKFVRSQDGKKLCYRCGRDNHLRDDCAARRNVHGEEITAPVGRNVTARHAVAFKRVARSVSNPEGAVSSIGARVHQRHLSRKGAGEGLVTRMVACNENNCGVDGKEVATAETVCVHSPPQVKSAATGNTSTLRGADVSSSGTQVGTATAVERKAEAGDAATCMLRDVHAPAFVRSAVTGKLHKQLWMTDARPGCTSSYLIDLCIGPSTTDPSRCCECVSVSDNGTTVSMCDFLTAVQFLPYGAEWEVKPTKLKQAMGDCRYAPGWVTVPATLRKHWGVDVIGPAASETKRLRMLVVVLEDNTRRLLLGRDASILFGLKTRRAVEWNIPAAALRDVVTAQRGAGVRAVCETAFTGKRVRKQQRQSQRKVTKTRASPQDTRGTRSRAGVKLWRQMKKDAAKLRSREERTAIQRGDDASLAPTLTDLSMAQSLRDGESSSIQAPWVEDDVLLLSAGDASSARTQRGEVTSAVRGDGDVSSSIARPGVKTEDATRVDDVCSESGDLILECDERDRKRIDTSDEVTVRMLSICNLTADSAIVNAGENVFAARFACDTSDLEFTQASARLEVIPEQGAGDDGKREGTTVHVRAADLAVPIDGHDDDDGVLVSRASKCTAVAAVSAVEGHTDVMPPSGGGGGRDGDMGRRGGASDGNGGRSGVDVGYFRSRPDTQVLGVISADGASIRMVKLGTVGTQDAPRVCSVHVELYDPPHPTGAVTASSRLGSMTGSADAPAVTKNFLDAHSNHDSSLATSYEAKGRKRSADQHMVRYERGECDARSRKRVCRDEALWRNSVEGLHRLCRIMPPRVVKQARAILEGQGYRLSSALGDGARGDYGARNALSSDSRVLLLDQPPPGYVQVRNARGELFWFSEGAEQRLHSVWDDYPGAVDHVADCVDLMKVDFSCTEAPELGVQEVAIGKQLTAEQRERLCTLLCENAVVFRDPTPGEVAGFSEPLKFVPLDPTDTKPINKPQWPVRGWALLALKHWRDEALRLGVIEEASSPHNHPIHVVKKKGWNRDNFLTHSRPVIAFDAGLNDKIQDYGYNYAPMATVADDTRGMQYFCKFDLAFGFNQAPLHPESRDYTAFTIPGDRQYRLTRGPMGAKPTPKYFQAQMDRLLSDVHGRREHAGGSASVCRTMMDDTLVSGTNFDVAFDTVCVFLRRLRGAHLHVKLSKMKLMCPTIDFLGVMWNKHGHTALPEKIRELVSLPPPRNRNGLMRWLGMINYHRRYFDPSYINVLEPIGNLLKASVKFVWDARCQQAYDRMRQMFRTSAIRLHYPDYSKQFIVRTDASDVGAGAILLQRGEDGQEEPLEYMAHRFSSSERKWCTVEKECYAVVLAFQKFRPYLFGCSLPFHLETDCRNLLFMAVSKNHRVQRWHLELAQFMFFAKHIAGKSNVVADYLSRAHEDAPENEAVASEAVSLADDSVGITAFAHIAPAEVKDADDPVHSSREPIRDEEARAAEHVATLTRLDGTRFVHHLDRIMTGLGHGERDINGKPSVEALMGLPPRPKGEIHEAWEQEESFQSDAFSTARVSLRGGETPPPAALDESVGSDSESASSDSDSDFAGKEYDERHVHIDDPRAYEQKDLSGASSHQYAVAATRLLDSANMLGVMIAGDTILLNRYPIKRVATDADTGKYRVVNDFEELPCEAEAFRVATEEKMEKRSSRTLLYRQLVKAQRLRTEAEDKQWQEWCADERMIRSEDDGVFYRLYVEPGSNTLIKQLMLPAAAKDLKRYLVKLAHHNVWAAHGGYGRTLYRLNQFVHWQGIRDDVMRELSTCLACAKVKARQAANTALTPVMAEYPFQMVSIDYVGPMPVASVEGYKYVFVVVDKFSRLVMYLPTRTVQAAETARAFNINWVSLYGVPEIIISDRGSNFTSRLWGELMKLLKIKHELCESRHHQGNGSVERKIRELNELLLKTVAERSRDLWPELLPFLAMGVNTSYCRMLGLTPFQAAFGRKMRTPMHAVLGIGLNELNQLHGYHDADPAMKIPENYCKFIRNEFAEVIAAVNRWQEREVAAMKKHYDATRVKPRVFRKGGWVLFFERAGRDRFCTSWSGPWVIDSVDPQGNRYNIHYARRPGIQFKHVSGWLLYPIPRMLMDEEDLALEDLRHRAEEMEERRQRQAAERRMALVESKTGEDDALVGAEPTVEEDKDMEEVKQTEDADLDIPWIDFVPGEGGAYDDEVYVPERIVAAGYDRADGLLKFRVRWEGWSSADDTLQTMEQLEGTDALNEYMARHPYLRRAPLHKPVPPMSPAEVSALRRRYAESG